MCAYTLWNTTSSVCDYNMLAAVDSVLYKTVGCRYSVQNSFFFLFHFLQCFALRCFRRGANRVRIILLSSSLAVHASFSGNLLLRGWTCRQIEVRSREGGGWKTYFAGWQQLPSRVVIILFINRPHNTVALGRRRA